MSTDVRQTMQKTAVWEALQSSGDFVSAQELHRQLVDSGAKVGLATVYRRLKALAGSGDAEVLSVGGVEQKYRACGRGAHHHHLVCTNCGRTVEIDPPTESWVDEIAAEHGFVVTDHVVEVLGVCPACRRLAGADAA